MFVDARAEHRVADENVVGFLCIDLAGKKNSAARAVPAPSGGKRGRAARFSSSSMTEARLSTSTIVLSSCRPIQGRKCVVHNP
jgi:hypothetical protein